MTIMQSIILGIVQGITEFLPVSSSAHLVLVPFFLGWDIPIEQAFPFDVLVQIGTLFSVVVYFRRDLVEIITTFFSGLKRSTPFEDHRSRLGWYIILATIPAGIAGLLLKSRIEAAFNSPLITGLFLFGTAAILVLAEFIGKRSRTLPFLKWQDALWIGLAQAVAIFPGISRSGATISGGLLRNLQRPAAARFSFLMSIPIMLAAGIVSLKDLSQVPNIITFLPILFIGFLTAALVGYVAIHWLLQFITKRSLYFFALYCAALGLITIMKVYV